MEVIQPLDLEAGFRCFTMLNQHRLTTTVKLFFPLNGGHPILNSDAHQAISELPHAYADEALPKLSTEYLVLAEAQAPGQQNVSAINCRISFNGKKKALKVIGDRFWTGGLSGATEPLPFNKMPLDWSRSFGGKDFELNPTGRGIDLVASPMGEKLIALPNIEDAKNMMTGKGQRPTPVNFCAIPQESPLRSRYLGTYNDQWLKHRFPGYPDDFQLEAFYNAPQDQRFNHFINGGEDFELEGFNHDSPLLSGKIPAYRVRIFIVRQGLEIGDIEAKDLIEIDNQIDTVTFYPNQKMGMLSYRGTLNSDTNDGSQYKHLLVAYENADQPERPKEHYLMSLIGRIHPDLNMQFALTTKDLIPDDVPCGIAQLTQQDEDPIQLLAQNLQQKSQQTMQEAKAEAEQKMQQLLAGLPEDKAKAIQTSLVAGAGKDEWTKKYEAILEKIAPGSVSKDGKVDLQKIDFKAFAELKDLQEEHAAALLQQAKDQVQQQIEELATKPDGHSLADSLAQSLLDMELPSPLPRPQNPADMLNQLQDAQQRMTAMAEKAQALGNQAIPTPDLNLEQIEASSLEAAQQMFEAYRKGAHMMEAGTPPLAAEQDQVMEAFLQRQTNGQSHKGRDYAGLNFSGMDLSEIDLSECFLEQCDFSGCDLSAANLAGAVAARANFSGAILNKANLQQSNIGACNFKDAQLHLAQTQQCEYARSCFDGASLHSLDLQDIQNTLEASFRNADLTGCQFGEANFVDMDFSKAILNQCELKSATFINCNLSATSWGQARISGANFIECNLSSSNFDHAQMNNCRFMQKSSLIEASFQNAQADNCNFRESQLNLANFNYASLNFCDFSKADAKQASFYGAELKQAQCMETDFSDSDLSNCNMLEANFMKARLTNSKIRKSNCYGVEFLAATTGKTDFSGSYMVASKLEHWRPSKWQS